jgi:hypothetical protein
MAGAGRALKKNAPKRRAKRKASKPQSLLILHLDAEKLHADGLHLGDVAEFSAALSATAFGSNVEVRDATTEATLLRVLAELAEQGRTYDVIVAIGHSNDAGIKIARDRFAEWPVFAAWLEPLKPRRLLLAACRAGRWSAGEALFTANDQLRRIFACPVNASRDFAAMMLFAVPYVVANRRPRDQHVLWSQIAAIAMTGRQLRQWQRTTDKGNPDSSVFDLLADFADPLARQVPDILGSAFRAFVGR